jgi:ABC-type amino acid transport substrate-binding protein
MKSTTISGLWRGRQWAVLIAGLVVVSACSGSAPTPTASPVPAASLAAPSTSTSAPASTAVSSQPAGSQTCADLATKYADLKTKTYVIALDGDSPPDEYTDPQDPTKIIGGDADVIRSVMDCLKLDSKFTVISFAGIIPAIAGGQADIQASAMSYTAARAQQNNFITFEKNVTGWMSLNSKFSDVSTIDGLCGHSVGILVGGTAQLDVDQINKTTCATNQISVQTFQDSSGIVQAVSNGRVDFGNLSLLTLQAFMKTNPQYAIRVSEDILGLVEGFSVRKSDSELLQALYDAMTVLQQNGVLQQDYTQNGMDPALLLEPAQIRTK